MITPHTGTSYTLPFTRAFVQVEVVDGIETWVIYVKLGSDPLARHPFMGPSGITSFVWAQYPQVASDVARQLSKLVDQRTVGIRRWSWHAV